MDCFLLICLIWLLHIHTKALPKPKQCKHSKQIALELMIKSFWYRISMYSCTTLWIVWVSEWNGTFLQSNWIDLCAYFEQSQHMGKKVDNFNWSWKSSSFDNVSGYAFMCIRVTKSQTFVGNFHTLFLRCALPNHTAAGDIYVYILSHASPHCRLNTKWCYVKHV